LLWTKWNGHPIKRSELAEEKKDFISPNSETLIWGGLWRDKAKFCKEEQFWKHLFPSNVTEFGIISDVNGEHSEKQ
jgi:hypothetical protein